MTAILFLRFQHHLQSWGMRAFWDIRDTAPYPTKKGVIGLLGCALGIPRYDSRLVQLQAALRMGIRQERLFSQCIDFQTARGQFFQADREQKPDVENIVLRKHYLEDATFLVALQGTLPLLQQLRDALLDPRWPLFLGRKCCVPSMPIYDDLRTDCESILEAFAQIPPTDATARQYICHIEVPTSAARGKLRYDKMTSSPLKYAQQNRYQRKILEVPSS